MQQFKQTRRQLAIKDDFSLAKKNPYLRNFVRSRELEDGEEDDSKKGILDMSALKHEAKIQKMKKRNEEYQKMLLDT